MESRTKNYLQKYFVRKLFGRKLYSRIKFFKILFKAKVGSKYEITSILLDVLRDDDVFFDIGANLGQYILRIKTKFKNGVNVFAFEPVISNYKMLNSYIEKKYKNVILEHYAVSDTEGEDVLYIPLIDEIEVDTQASIDLKNRENYYNNFIKQEIRKITVDKYVENKGLKRIDYLKVDTEGNDTKVLAGALESIRKFTPVIFCEDMENLEIISELERMSYKRYMITYKYELIELNTAGKSDVFNDLMVFIPENRKQIFQNYILNNRQ